MTDQRNATQGRNSAALASAQLEGREDLSSLHLSFAESQTFSVVSQKLLPIITAAEIVAEIERLDQTCKIGNGWVRMTRQAIHQR
jgi:hypothetical protein